jgi:hypothetical protein
VSDGLAAKTHILLNKIATDLKIGLEVYEIKRWGDPLPTISKPISSYLVIQASLLATS